MIAIWTRYSMQFYSLALKKKLGIDQMDKDSFSPLTMVLSYSFQI